MTILGIITLLFLFAESGGQVAGNLKGSKQNFHLSDVLNILVSVTGTYKVLCPLLHSASHKSDGYQPSLSFLRSAALGFFYLVLLSHKFKNSYSNARASCHFVSQLFVGKVRSLRFSVKYQNID